MVAQASVEGVLGVCVAECAAMRACPPAGPSLAAAEAACAHATGLLLALCAAEDAWLDVAPAPALAAAMDACARAWTAALRRLRAAGGAAATPPLAPAFALLHALHGALVARRGIVAFAPVVALVAKLGPPVRAPAW